ncbi:MAG: esterase [Chitinophagaceae bacterium]|nr:MAG: esterase [Chitinophagaceae bacterium]
MKTLQIFIALLVLSAHSVVAQRPPSVSSPEVHTDRSVTFRYYSRTAKKVMLRGEFLKTPVALTSDTSGIWQVTVSDIRPDIYPYSFMVDSVELADPNSTLIFANERFKRSLVEVPGNKPLVHSLQDVPHGRITYRWYQSGNPAITRRLLVYTPPGFDGSRQYPVLYLIHGGSDTEETWTKVGRANLIADNLVAAGKATPMIIVMPYGNVRPRPMSDFTKEMMTDIIPFIESNYPVLPGSASRAIAGFSVGGGQTLNIAFSNPGSFAWVSAYAPYTETEEFRKNFRNWSPDAAAINSGMKLFSISVGTDDFLYEPVKKNIAMFKSKKIRVKSYVVPGGHTWMNGKQYLSTTLQEIFR